MPVIVPPRLLFLLALCWFAYGNLAAQETSGGQPTQPSHAAAISYRLEAGEIEGARFSIAIPKNWNGNVMLLAHGHRPENAPLVADLPIERAAYQTLLQEGWIIAKTSYRRNGVIVTDAIADLDNLRSEIVRRVGPPARVVLEGESMGGLICLRIAERPLEPAPLYHGVIAIGSSLQLRDPGDTTGLNLQPQLPVVLLANRSEFEPSRQYAAANIPAPARPHAPYLLRVNRDGHININQAERLFTFRVLNLWLDHTREALPKTPPDTPYLDATRIPEPQPSRVFMDSDGRGFTAHVAELTSVFGNLLLDAQPADFQAIGLSPNAYFEVTVGKHTIRALYGRDFNSVKHGEWVVFANADGFVWLARNRLSAAASLAAQLGDVVQVRRYDATPPPAE